MDDTTTRRRESAPRRRESSSRGRTSTSRRREFLAAAGIGLLGSAAGCVEPGASTGDDGGNGDSPSRSMPDSDEQPERAEGSAYTDVYEATIDSVTFIRVFGIESRFSQESGQGQGSGFVYDEDHVVTNHHVVAGGDEIDLQYPNGDWASAEVVGTDFYSDLAVLEVDHRPEVAAPLSFADVRPVVGQEVLAIGNPYGLEGSASRGIVSGVDRSLRPPEREFAFSNVVQTDAAVNPGNSGGPLVDLDGDVVGVVNAGWGQTIGFAISAALSRRVVPALIDDGEYRHSLLGIRSRPVDPRVAEANDLADTAGVIVVDVTDDGPAAGVLEPSDDDVTTDGTRIPVGGDVIVAIDGRPIPDGHALSTHLALRTSPGDTVAVEVIRDGRRRTLEVTLGERDPR